MDGYALVVQFFVGLSAISTLLIKRQWETPQRPWLVWSFDASKQALAACAMHLINVLASTISGDLPDYIQKYDPCVWYLTCLLVDGTLLVFLMTALLKSADWFVGQRNISTLRHGEYGDPPRPSIWLQQLSLYALLLFSAKGITLWVLYRQPYVFVSLAGWILTPVIDYRRVELVMVMMVIPLATSIFQYWLIDQLIKADWQDTISTRWQILPAVVPEDEDDAENGSDSITVCKARSQVCRDLIGYHGLESLSVLATEDHFHVEDKLAS